MEQLEILDNLSLFVVTIFIYYVLSLIGALTAFFVKKSLPNGNKDANITSIFTVSIIPATIMTMLNIAMLADMDYTYKYGLAMCLGLVGEDISKTLVTTKNVFLLLNHARKLLAGVTNEQEASELYRKIENNNREAGYKTDTPMNNDEPPKNTDGHNTDE